MRAVSIVIPALYEGDRAARLAAVLRRAPGTQVIVALADGDGRTEEPQSGDNVIVTRSAPGRARQMNAGARAATGDILLFLHADTRIDPASLGAVRAAMERPDAALGAYRLRIDSPSPMARIVAAVANLRSRFLGMPYGDQALFLRRETFEKLGGFDDVPILEDVRLVEAASRLGEVVMLDDEAVTSARRWEERGFIKNTLRNFAIMLAYKAGASPRRLCAWYGAGRR